MFLIIVYSTEVPTTYINTNLRFLFFLFTSFGIMVFDFFTSEFTKYSFFMVTVPEFIYFVFFIKFVLIFVSLRWQINSYKIIIRKTTVKNDRRKLTFSKDFFPCFLSVLYSFIFLFFLNFLNSSSLFFFSWCSPFLPPFLA